MQMNRSPRDSDPASPNAEEDRQWQSAVLNHVLAEDPRQLSEKEIIRALAGEKLEFDQVDAARRAIEELIRAGVLRRCEAMVLLTKPARHFASLEVS